MLTPPASPPMVWRVERRSGLQRYRLDHSASEQVASLHEMGLLQRCCLPVHLHSRVRRLARI